MMTTQAKLGVVTMQQPPMLEKRTEFKRRCHDELNTGGQGGTSLMQPLSTTGWTRWTMDDPIVGWVYSQRSSTTVNNRSGGKDRNGITTDSITLTDKLIPDIQPCCDDRSDARRNVEQNKRLNIDTTHRSHCMTLSASHVVDRIPNSSHILVVSMTERWLLRNAMMT